MTDSINSAVSQLADSTHITVSLERLRQLSQLDLQTSWRYHLGEVAIAQATQSKTWQQWQTVSLNARQHVAWDKGRNVLWLGQSITVPETLQGYPLIGLTQRIALTWWAEAAQIFVNGELVQEGDLFDCSTRLLLNSAVQPGDTVDVAIRLVSPGHDDGALVLSRCLYERPDHQLDPCPEPGFVADELAVLQIYLAALQPQRLTELAEAIAQINWSVLPDRAAFDRSLTQLRQQLQPLGQWLKQRQIQLLGHAHLDLAWLWEISETWDAAERTFKSVLQLQSEFPELIFCHSTPALYDWIEQNRPALFKQIQQQIAAGRWEVVAGLWVEPELNTVSGESIARQVLYGQRDVQAKFGELSPIAWLPDSFGFCWQLPQILQLGRVEYFVTQKLRWNDTNSFPHEAFWWRSPNGSQVFSLMSPPIGEGINPVKMAQYATDWEVKTGISTALWLPGVGDHGGGPTRDMLNLARRWQNSPFFPTLEFGTALNYLHRIQETESPPQPDPPNSLSLLEAETGSNAAVAPNFPIWNDELYLEFHRGCYTSHADQKRSNRRCEIALYQAELFATIATRLNKTPYPKAKIETAWKQVLFNQFHDILPGSAIAEVYIEANQAWNEAETTAAHIIQVSLEAIAQQIDLPAPPNEDAVAIVVFNPLNWVRSEVVTCAIDQSMPGSLNQNWQILDMEGREIESHCQIHAEQECGFISFHAADIPAIGYRVFWQCPIRESSTQPFTQPIESAQLSDRIEPLLLENECLRVTIDPQTGDLASVYDKLNEREVLSGAGNQLQAFQDSGQYWDAWNIDPNYAQHPLPPAKLDRIERVTQTSLQTQIHVIRTIGQSEFQQTYCLEKGSAVLKIHTLVDWTEEHVMVKVAFPLNVESNFATYEIPYGAIERPHPTAEDPVKWEVPALQWADLGNSDYGVSLLNDCKYGYDNQINQLRLTLLRSPNYPHFQADRGRHEFTYALYPHGDRWQTAQTVQRGYELNQPLRVLRLTSNSQTGNRKVEGRSLPTSGELLNLQADNLILTAFKPAEDQPDQWILRCYECHGQPATLQLKNSLGLAIDHPTDLLEQSLLEQPLPNPAISSSAVAEIAPWQIATFKLSIKN
jgi:alpha-mannosidase